MDVTYKNRVWLGNVATIQMGYSYPGRQSTRPQLPAADAKYNPSELHRQGLIPFINVKDVREDRELAPARLALLKRQSLDARTMLLQPEDIIFLAHGERFIAKVIPHTIDEALCSAYFYAIRIDAGNLLPEYVSWYLNSQATKSHLRKVSVGSDIKFIPRAEIMRIPLPVPKVEIQRKIAAIEAMRVKENRLMDELKIKRNLLIKAGLDNLINN